MAQKYGGPYSPDDSGDKDQSKNSNVKVSIDIEVDKFRGKKVHKTNTRNKLLYLAPLPLLFSSIGELQAGDADGFTSELFAFVILIFAAWLLQAGIEARFAYEERKIARPPAIPRIIFASVLTGFGVFIASLWGAHNPMGSALTFGIVAALAHSFAFGIDPLKKKGMGGVDDYDAERVARAVDKAEALLGETVLAAKDIKDRALEARVQRLASQVRDMFRRIEDDPRDLSSARKFLSVYLKGARDATIKFAGLYAKTRDADARSDYEALLSDLETSFAAQSETMLLDDRTDLDIEIEVLRDRLKQEGLRAKR